MGKAEVKNKLMNRLSGQYDKQLMKISILCLKWAKNKEGKNKAKESRKIFKQIKKVVNDV